MSAIPEPAPSTGALPPVAPSRRPQVPCDRCGTFTQRPVKPGARSVCAACAPLLRKELRLYPYVYLNVVGVLLNFALAGFLAAINWKRLGDRERMRNALFVGAAGVVGTIAFLVLEVRFVFLLPFSILGTWVASHGLKEPYEQHRRAGGARANLFLPVILTVLVMLTAAFAFVVAFLASGGIAPEEDF